MRLREEEAKALKALYQLLEPLGFFCISPGRHALEKEEVFDGINGDCSVEYIRRQQVNGNGTFKDDKIKLKYYLNGQKKLEAPYVSLRNYSGKSYDERHEVNDKLVLLIKDFFGLN